MITNNRFIPVNRRIMCDHHLPETALETYSGVWEKTYFAQTPE
jgi:hypothetical protein